MATYRFIRRLYIPVPEALYILCFKILFLAIVCRCFSSLSILRAHCRYHDDEDVGDVESWTPGSVSATRERWMSAHLRRVTLVELVHHTLERLHLLVQSPLLLVHERLHVDRRRLPVVVFQLNLIFQTLRHDRYCNVLYRQNNKLFIPVVNVNETVHRSQLNTVARRPLLNCLSLTILQVISKHKTSFN